VSSGLTRRALIGSAVLAVLIGTMIGVLLASISAQQAAAERARRSQEVIAAANDLEKLVVDMETGVRGFVITGAESFLQPYRSAARDFPLQADRLEQMVSADADQEARARTIARRVESYLDDYAAPLVLRVRSDPAAARGVVSTNEGRRRINAIRSGFDRLTDAETAQARARADDASSAATRSKILGWSFLAATILLIALFALYLIRRIAAPLTHVAGAAEAVAAGDLMVRVPTDGPGEVGELGRTFNAMTASLAEARDELEGQNAELEHQQAEVEQQNVEMEHQQVELERALEELASQKDQVDAYARFGDRIVADLTFEERAATVLGELADLADAEVGALYVVTGEGGYEDPALVSVRGVEPEAIPSRVIPGRGLDGRAFAEGRVIVTDRDRSDLRIVAFGVPVAPRHELHAPLTVGPRVVGVITLARVGDRPFSGMERELIGHLAGQAAVALVNAIALRLARRQAGITAAMIDSTPDGVRLTSPDGRTLIANRAMQRLADEVGVPMGAEDVAAFAERLEDPAAYRAEADAIIADPEREGIFEYTVADLRRTFQRYTAPVRDADGEQIGRVWLVRDVSAERDAERMKDEFVALVSHELRTPLTSIMGYLDLVLSEEGATLTEEQRRFLGVVSRNSQRLLRLVGDLLFLARVDAGRLSLEAEEVDLGALAADCVEAARPMAEEREVELTMTREAVPPLNVDRARLAQLLDNLVSNALKFTPAGGSANVDVRGQNGRALISVSDTGMGIAEADIERLFDRFYRTSNAARRAIPGTGLGLAIARAIAEAHGGDITVRSVEGEGTTFEVALPFPRRQRTS
jgi:signal transduction histidine kinase/CHASE3 domain sensor protein